MAPVYRNQNRRQNRTGYVDHDVFEGLPVRQWRRDYTTIVPPTTQESTSQNDIWAVELPHGMPKDSHLLPQHSQDLLRAARSGKIYKRSAPVEEEEVDVEAVVGDKLEKKDDDLKDRGYTVKAWKPVPRHQEGVDLEYLAKRRKGLITITSKPASVGPSLTKATVKTVDAAGNEYVQDVVVPQGQKVDGEVISQTTIPDPSTTVVGDGSAAPTPIKRKGPPKRKAKGSGRGRRKKPIAPTSAPQLPQVDGVALSTEGVEGVAGEDGIKTENDSSNTPTNNEDTEMADGSMHDSDDEEGEEGEEGDEDDEGSVDQQGSPTKPPRQASATPQTVPTMPENPSAADPDTEMSGTEATARPPILHLDRERLEMKSGSPLKNIALTTSALASPLEPSTTAAPPFSDPEPVQQELQHITETTELTRIDAAMQEEATITAPTTLPPPPPEPTIADMEAAVEVREEEEEEEGMLLDIVDNANNTHIGGGEALPDAAPEPIIETAQEPGPTVEIEPSDPTAAEPELGLNPELEAEPVEEPIAEPAEVPVPAESTAVDQTQPKVPQPVEDDDDDFPDLLGGLEKQLNDPVAKAPDAVEPILTGEAALPPKPAEVVKDGEAAE